MSFIFPLYYVNIDIDKTWGDRMSKKNLAKKQSAKKTETKSKDYRNPAETIWGKIIIWTLLVGMVGGVVFGLILALINI